MPRVSRKRLIAASPAAVWALVSDPHDLPRWWPRTARVESVDRRPGGVRSQWTQVLQTSEGRGVRADFRCVGSTEQQRYAWEQQLADSPFGRHLRSSAVEIRMKPAEAGTEVQITSSQILRGMSRLGGPMMRRGQGSILDQALDGIERALTGEGEDR